MGDSDAALNALPDADASPAIEAYVEKRGPLDEAFDALPMDDGSADEDVWEDALSRLGEPMDGDAAGLEVADDEACVVVPYRRGYDTTTLARGARCCPDDDLDESDLATSIHRLVTKSTYSTGSDAASRCNIDRKRFRSLRLVTAAITVKHSAQQWQDMERTIGAASDVVHHVFVEFEAYDGVDLTLRTQGRFDVTPAARCIGYLSGGSAVAEPSASVADAGPDSSGAVSSPSVATVLQSMGTNGMLFARDGELCLITGEQLHHLQVADRHTSECLYGMLAHHQEHKAHRQRCRRKVRVICVYCGSNHRKAEKKDCHAKQR